MNGVVKTSTSTLKQVTAFTLWCPTLAIGIVLVFAYSLPQDLSKTSRLYANLVAASFFIRVLTFHLGLLMLGLTVAGLCVRRWWLASSNGILMLTCLAPVLITLRPRDISKINGPTLRIMAMNLKYTHENGQLITDQLKNFNPDVVVIEDYTPYSKEEIDRLFGADYSHRGFLFNYLQGLAIYSRFPFEGGRPKSTFTKIRRQMRAVIQFHGRDIAVYVEHPFSPRSRQRIINNRLSTLDLVQQLRNEKLPVILAGDFNFTADTPNQRALIGAGVQDGFDLAGTGRGATWPMEPKWMQWLPGVRIDHIFVSRELTCSRFWVGSYTGSDHLPVIADVGFSK